MNKQELVASMVEKTGQSRKDIEASLNAFISTVSEELKSGGKVQLIGFGTFDVAERAERDGFNPQTKEKIKIQAMKTPRFKAGKSLKDMVK